MVIGIDIRNLVGQNTTGVGVYTLSLLKQIFIKDNINSYKLFFNQAKKNYQPVFSQLANCPNVKIYQFRYPNKLLNFSLKYFKRPFLDKMIGGADIFWFPNYNFWQVSKSCHILATVHDLSYVKMPWAYKFIMRWWHLAVNPKKQLEQADKIIAISVNTKNDLVELYHLPQDKIEVVYSGIESQVPYLKSHISNPESKVVNIKLPEKFILYLGTLEPRKNVESVIRAFERVGRSDLHLVIAGGQGWLYQKIYQAARHSQYKNQIHFIGYISNADRLDLYLRAQMLVWPSFYEGFGFPPLEAMLQGCPVITSTNSSLPEVAGDAALLVDPYNIQEIAVAVNQLLTDEKLFQSLVSRGYELAKKFTWEKSAQKMLEIFKSMDY